MESPADNYFSLFDLDERFDIDVATLEQKLLEKISKTHPDKFLFGSKEEVELATKKTALLNEAYQILSDPIKRAKYILIKHSYLNDEQDLKMPQKLLIESMGKMDALQLSESYQDVLKLLDNALQEKLEKLKEIQYYFIENNYQKSLEIYVELKFITRFLSEIENKIHNFGPR